MNKNGFEIRLEVLKMAKEIMDQNYNQMSNAWWGMVNSYSEQSGRTIEDLTKQSKELMETCPKMYTPAEIMAKAQELYSFVSKKD